MKLSPHWLLTSAAVAGAAPALAGCSAADDPAPSTQSAPPATERDYAIENVEPNLARLRGLEVFEVRELVVRYPLEAISCYGPCPGSEGLMEEIYGNAALELARFTDLAEEAAYAPIAGSCEAGTIERNLAALRALDVVEVGELIVEHASATPNCYNLPCAADVAAAEAVTCDRADKLASIAERSARR